MILKECMLINNDCYKKGTKMKPAGIVVHSTGSPNMNLRRYVQPVAPQDCYEEVIQDLGVNKYNNHWNRSAVMMGRSVCVHAFIGINAKGKIETYQTLPWNICCWGCGKGKNGSYNYNPPKIQFEICEDSLSNQTYFMTVMKEAQEFCAYLCKKFDFGVDQICSHYEAYHQGYGSNHGDPDHWLKKFGKDMDWFRQEVQKLLGDTVTATKTVTMKIGDLVAINADAKYYNGKTIPDWAKKQKWYISSIRNNRAVIGKNEQKTSTLNGIIEFNDLTLVDNTFHVGDKVKLKSDAVIFGTDQKFALWAYTMRLCVVEIDENKARVAVRTTSKDSLQVDIKDIVRIN